jgi:tetratricopeptide (TPR) repeat protein
VDTLTLTGLQIIAQATVRICKVNQDLIGQGVCVPILDPASGDKITLVLTCQHVVDATADKGNIPLVLFSPMDLQLGEAHATYCPERSDPSSDVAVLIVNGNLPIVAPRLVRLAEPYNGPDKVVGVVRPIGSSQRLNARLAEPTPLPYNGITIPRVWRLIDSTDVRRGISGSPIILMDGIIGLTHQSRVATDESNKEAYVIPIQAWFAKNPELTALDPDAVPLPVDLSDVFELLSWRMPITPLIGAQANAELQRLEEWATAGPKTPRLRLLTGPGGAGKTRIASELIKLLRSEGRWAEFYAGNPQPHESGLIVVDYPEERPDIAEFFDKVANVRTPMRVLLLSRRSLDWWQNALGARTRHLIDKQPIEVGRLSNNDVIVLYRAILTKLSHLATQSAVIDNEAILKWIERDALHTLPLFVRAVAIQSLLQGSDALRYSARDLIQALVDREIDRLNRASKNVGFTTSAAARIAAIAAVRGSIDIPTLERIAQRTLKIGTSEPHRVVDDIRRLPWWRNDSWAAPSPDIVAAALVYTVLSERADMAPEWLWAAINDLTSDTTIERLGRISHDVGTVYGLEQQELNNWLIQMIEQDTSRARILEFFAYQRLPGSIAPLGAAACNALLQHSTADKGERAGILNNLAGHLRDSGDRTGALNAAQLAVEIDRELAAARPTEIEPQQQLAMALITLSNCQNESGDRRRALASIQEAVQISRRVETAQPGSHELLFATSLNNLAQHLRATGNRPGALAAIQEAVEILRRLATTHSGALEQLALGLNNLANELDASGDPRGALAASSEAVEMYRQVALVYPAAFEQDLAMFLNNLANHISSSGDRPAALATTRESVEIYRRLAKAQPKAFDAALATSLNNLTGRLSDNGDKSEALVAATEALEIGRRQADAHPAAFEVTLADSLNGLSNALSDNGDQAGALAAIQESTAIRRRLARAEPAAFDPGLVISLNNLAGRLKDSGDRPGTLTAVQEATEAYRRLAATEPARYEPELAKRLYMLFVLLSSTEDTPRALAAIEEAASIYRRLATAQPEMFESDLAGALRYLSVLLHVSGDQREALSVARESIQVYRRLATSRPSTFEPDLAVSLRYFSELLSNHGDARGAVDAIQEAIEIYQRLASDQPATFQLDLATGHRYLSQYLLDSGDQTASLIAIQKAVEMHRLVAENQPNVEAELAMSLHNLSAHLGSVDDRAGALAAVHEAIAIWRRLTLDDSANLESHLNKSQNLLNRLNENEQNRRD